LSIGKYRPMTLEAKETSPREQTHTTSS